MFAAGQNVSRRWLSWRKQLKRKPRTTKHRSRKSGRGMPLPWKSSLNNLNRPKGWAEMNYRNALFCFWVLHKNVTVLGPSAHICRAELSLFVHDDCHNWTKCVSCECIEAPGFGVCESLDWSWEEIHLEVKSCGSYQQPTCLFGEKQFTACVMSRVLPNMDTVASALRNKELWVQVLWSASSHSSSALVLGTPVPAMCAASGPSVQLLPSVVTTSRAGRSRHSFVITQR